MTDLIRQLRRAPFQAGMGLLCALYAAIILLTFRSYGITNDEPLHIAYGEAILAWYGSLGAVTDAATLVGTKHYGGVFDALGAIAGRMSPIDPYETKHLLNALVGLAGVVAVYRIGSLLAGPSAGLVAAIFLLLTPRYYGHAFNNPKDIPFAVFYVWSVYWMLAWFRTFPDVPWRTAAWTGLAIGLTLAIRVGGVLLGIYLCLFVAVGLVFLQGRNRALAALRPLGIRVLAVGGLSWLIMMAFWPFAQTHPIVAPIESLTRFSEFPDVHLSYFDGRYVNSIQTPRTYLVTWLLLTLPELIGLGLACGFGLLVAGGWRQLRSRPGLQHAFLAFSAFFPIAYSIAFKPALYDGMRHFLFVLPPLAALAGVSLVRAYRFVGRPGATALAVAATVFGGMAAGEMVRLHPNQVVYFNEWYAGGLDEASRRYETDYWRHAQKQAIQWISRTYGDDYDRRVRVSSRFTGIGEQMPDDVVLVDFRDAPDFYVGSTRYDEHLSIPGEVVHAVRAGETELAWVVRPDEAYQWSEPFTNSFFADLHRRPIYLREARFFEELGDSVRAARSYLKLSRSVERLKANADLLKTSEAALAAEALRSQKYAVSLLPSPEDALTVARRFAEDGNHLVARDLLMGLVANHPTAPYLAELIPALVRTEEHDLARSYAERWLALQPAPARDGLAGILASAERGDLAGVRHYLGRDDAIHD